MSPKGGTTRVVFSVLFGNIASAGFAFALNVLLARLLTKGDFGRVNLLFSMVTVLYTFGDFGFSSAAVVFYNSSKQSKDDPLGQLNRCYCEFLGVVLILLVGILLMLAPLYHMTFFETGTALVALICFCLYRHALSLLQAMGAWAPYNTLNIGGNFLKVMFLPPLFFGLGWWGGRYGGALVGYTLQSLALVGMGAWFLKGKMYLCEVDRDVRGALWKILWPLGVVNISVVLTMRFGVFLVEKVLGPEELAILSAANTLALVFPLITTSIMNVLLKESAATPGREFLTAILRKQRRFLPVLLGVLILSMLLARPMTVLLFGPGYRDAGGLLAWLLIPYIGGVFFTPLESYFYGNDQRLLMRLRIVQLGFTVLISILLIGKIGLYAIVWGTVLTRAMGWIYIFMKVRSLLGDGGHDRQNS
jgi:O-antigen/teichoic acid export membrane protein